jgi:hypothetical protein
VTVVTEDHLDRPPWISLLTACGEMGVSAIRLADFIHVVTA